MERSTDAPDESLVGAVLDGDEAAFRLLYRRHTPRLKQLVLRVVGEPRADAEDVVQETWVRAVAALRRFRWESAFGTWLVGIGVRTASELLRRRRRRHESDGGEDAAVEHLSLPAGERVDLERALAALPDGHRAVLLLHDLEGFTHEEIGIRLGIATGTSKATLFRARRAVRALLGDTKEVSRDATA